MSRLKEMNIRNRQAQTISRKMQQTHFDPIQSDNNVYEKQLAIQVILINNFIVTK
jgi:hypothetical protein